MVRIRKPGARATGSTLPTLLGILVAAVAGLAPFVTAAHVSTVTAIPTVASGWTSPTNALVVTDGLYASTVGDGDALAVGTFALPPYLGSILGVTLKIDQTQVGHSDDRYTISGSSSGCSGVNFADANPAATGSRTTLLTSVQCTNGWTWSRIGSLSLNVRSEAHGGIPLVLSGIDGEWRVYGAWLEIVFSNTAPVAVAGPDQSILETSTTSLTAAGSQDPDGDPIIYDWAQTGGPAGALSGASTMSPTVTAPTLSTNAAQTMVFRLSVTDAAGHASTDTVSIVVNNINGAPTANAGPDATVASGAAVQLQGSGSDPDSDTITYSWRQVAGPSVTLSGATTQNPAFTAPTGPTALSFELTTTDALGLSSPASKTTTNVQAPPPSTTSASPTATTAPAPSSTTASTPPPTTSTTQPPGTSSTAPSTSSTRPVSQTPVPTTATSEPPPLARASTDCEAIVPPWDATATVPIAFPSDCGLELVTLEDARPPPGPVPLRAIGFRGLPDGTTAPGSPVPSDVGFEIEFGNVSTGPVAFARARIDFIVPPTWLEESCPAGRCAVRLYHAAPTGWETLNATYIGEAQTGAVYRAYSHSLSAFVVGGEPVAADAQPGSDGPGFVPLAMILGFLAALAAAVLVAALLVARSRARRLPPTPAAATATAAPKEGPGAIEARASRLIKEMRNNQELVQFVNNAAHDLANPLTPINVQLHMLLMDDKRDAESKRKSLSIVKRNVEQLGMLITDLKDASRIQAGKLRIDAQPADLAQLARNTFESYQEQARAANIGLELDVGSTLPASIDEGRITQVVTNLLNNALKFTPAGGRITLRGAVEEGMAMLMVQDSGLGLTEADIAALFKPFSQVHGAAEKKKGTGLGLFISKGIVEQHGGRIGCTSPGKGQGATFWFAVPLLGAAAKPAAPVVVAA